MFSQHNILQEICKGKYMEISLRNIGKYTEFPLEKIQENAEKKYREFSLRKKAENTEKNSQLS
jgi:hypothetical protein